MLIPMDIRYFRHLFELRRYCHHFPLLKFLNILKSPNLSLSVEDSCGVPPDIPFSFKFPSGITVGAVVHYYCYEGYMPSDYSNFMFGVQCQANGNWSTNLTCVGR